MSGGVFIIACIMYKILFFLIIAFCFLSANAGIRNTTFTTIRSYKGTIGKYPVRMFLKISENHVEGEYVYLKNGSTFGISGKILPGNKLILDELNKNFPDDNSTEYTGNGNTFELINSQNYDLRGIWRDTAGHKKFNVILYKTFEISFSETDLKIAHRNNDPMYKIDTIEIAEANRISFLKCSDTLFFNKIKGFGSPDFDFIDDALNKDNSIKYLIDTINKDNYSEGLGMPYRYSTTWYLEFINEHILSVVQNAYEYTGGMHGNDNIIYFNYDVATGKPIILSSEGEELRNDEYISLFTENYSDYLDSIGEYYFRKRTNIKSDQTFSDSRYNVEDGRFSVSESYYFSVSGISFIYDTGTYMGGTILYNIPYKALKPIINPDGPLAWVLKEF
jgi:hypothetical protein